jgi:hypothetical protein
MVARVPWTSRATMHQHSNARITVMPRRFAMVRHSDPSGVSGVGLVAYGVQFDDGHVAVRWVSEAPSTSLWDGVADLMAVHGHEGATVIYWIDPEPGSPGTPSSRANGTAQHRPDTGAHRPTMSHRATGRHRAE